MLYTVVSYTIYSAQIKTNWGTFFYPRDFPLFPMAAFGFQGLIARNKSDADLAKEVGTPGTVLTGHLQKSYGDLGIEIVEW